MGTLVELALALAAQYTLNRQLASLRAESQSLIVSLTVFAVVCVTGVTGFGFLLVALYAELAEHYDTPEAALIMGGVLLVVAAAVIAVSMVRARRRAGQSTAIPTLPVHTVAHREADAVMDEFKKVLGSASPLAIAAAVVGLAVGLAGAKMGQAAFAGARR
jgi:hypothetical protein